MKTAGKNYKETRTHQEKPVYVYSFTEEDQKNIVTPFLKGKYSEIDRDYVKTFDRWQVVDGFYEPSKTYMIFTKDTRLKEDWEQKIGVEFTDEQEVWSRPLIENETLA